MPASSPTTNSTPEKLDALLAYLKAELDEAWLARAIDTPLNIAAETLLRRVDGVPSTAALLSTLGKLIQRTYCRGLRVPRLLTGRQARAEAIAVLDEGYKSVTGLGYDAAVLDAVDANPGGLGLVLRQLVEILCARERRRHIAAVIATSLGLMDWGARRSLTEYLLKRLGPFLSAEVMHAHPALFADEIRVLLSQDLAVDRFFEGLAATSHALYPNC